MITEMKAKAKKRKVRRLHIMLFAVMLALLLAPVAPTFAQSPVPIVVDTNAIFTSANTWIEVFSPIMAIGIGISIALAILTFIGYQIIKAFQGSRR